MLHFISKNKSKIGFKSLFFGLIFLASSLQATDRKNLEDDEGIKFGLSIDGINGGGIQNYMSALWLEKLEELFLKDHKVQLHRVFDHIGGTSFGGVLGLGLAHEILVSEQMPMFEDKKQRKLLFSERQDHHLVTKFFKEKFGESTFNDLKIPVLLTGCSTDQIPYCCFHEKNIQNNNAYLYNIAYEISQQKSYQEVFKAYPDSIIPNNRLFRKNQADFLKIKIEQQWPNAEISILSLGTGITGLEPSWFSPINDSRSDILPLEDEKSNKLKKLMGKNYTRIDCDIFEKKASNIEYLKYQAESQMSEVVQYYQDNCENFRKSLERKDKK